MGQRVQGHPGAPTLMYLSPPPGVCALGKKSDPAGDRRGLGPEPGGARPAAPGAAGPPTTHTLCGGPSCRWPQPQAPSEYHLAQPPAPPQPDAVHLPQHPRDLTPAHSLVFPQVAISRPGFRGCVKRLRLDGRLLGAPTRMVGVTPCVSGPLEKGLFFTGSGGAITLGLSLTRALPGLLGGRGAEE